MVIPTILEKSWEEIEKKFKVYKSFANTVHVDFIDGKFTDSLTFLDPNPFSKYSGYFNLEAHLMVEEPANYLDGLASAGFKRFLGQVEKMSDQVKFVAKGQSLGSVGLALDIETPIEAIKVSLEDLDQILLMSIIAGASGRPFDQRVIPKMKELRTKYTGTIEVDGGINDQTLVFARTAGANRFCVNSFLFKGDPKKQFDLLSSLL
ncbi:MAG: Ribulose-phosphate 3-epimerase [uncultured bacterium]|nr:MAG: Ribulose-phosphate 3-epimerase [uncultured bacterium]